MAFFISQTTINMTPYFLGLGLGLLVGFDVLTPLSVGTTGLSGFSVIVLSLKLRII